MEGTAGGRAEDRAGDRAKGMTGDRAKNMTGDRVLGTDMRDGMMTVLFVLMDKTFSVQAANFDNNCFHNDSYNLSFFPNSGNECHII